MAASSEAVDLLQTERVVNRWIVDYYLSLAFDLFKKKQYLQFCEIRDVLNCVTDRPVESTWNLATKLRVLQFLSRIHEGESLDVSFEHDESIPPLESALMLLENISQENNIPQHDVESAHTSIKEMLVATCIKNSKFEKAKEVLRKHFSKAMVGKKAIFMGLVKQKSASHQVIEDIDFQQFKEEMLNFCETFCTFGVPFLHKAAVQLLDKRGMMQDDTAAELDEQEKHGPASNCNPQITSIQFSLPCKGIIITRTRLEAAYNALAAGLEVRTFAELEKVVELEARKENISMQHLHGSMKDTEVDMEQDELPQRGPLEVLPAQENGLINAASQTTRKKRLYTVAHLVVGPDSQRKLRSTTAIEKLEPEADVEEPEQLMVPANKRTPQSPLTDSEVVTKPIRRLPRRNNRARHNVAKASSATEAEPSLPTVRTSVEKHHNQSNSSPHNVAETSSDGEDQPSLSTGKTSVERRHSQSNGSPSEESTTSKQIPSDCIEDPKMSLASWKIPVQKPHKRQASSPVSDKEDATCNTDFAVHGSTRASLQSSPQQSSTPHREHAHNKDDSHNKWKQLYNNAKESKDTWSDEESLFGSKYIHGKSDNNTMMVSGHRKKKWTDAESQKLKEGVEKFGEGNWSKIKSYYSFKDRTNINLKDRWRTMKKLNMV
ncbi:telomeric repeat binding factor a [Thalassophryne amazonica]|uniref:telomeric repeat binding factor a n=1 Tax=Thalassophryne amazonica TaxID=390379 RepID=UPI001471EDE8|nr:telomeric repeat binding factor a [Thalassophryne amazonica]